MTNNLVDTSANTFWEIVVVQWRWVAVTFQSRFVHNTIDFICCYSGTKCFSGNIKHFSAHLTNMAQSCFPIKFFRCVDSNRRIARPVFLFRLGNTSHMVRIIRLANRQGDRPFWTVQGWTQRSREVVPVCPIRQRQLLRVCRGWIARNTALRGSLPVNLGANREE